MVLPRFSPISLVSLLALTACDETIAAVPAPTAAPAPSAIAPAPPAPGETPAQRGKVYYERYCDFCHGAAGQGYAADNAPALANEEFLAIASDDFLKQSIARGRPGTTMSAWGKALSGPLDDEAVAAVIAYIRTWQKRPFASVDDRVVIGDVARGQTAFDANCKDCHGATGEGAKAISVTNPEFLAIASNGFLATTIERGRTPTAMIPFSPTLGAATIGDLVAVLRSWQRPVDTFIVPMPPAPGKLGTVVLNPGGPEPAFDATADFIPADLVKAELDRGATMVIADARAPSDYVHLHVAGAIDVPFYQVDPYIGQIPKERFIVTYCGCPHAESSQSRDAFRRLGYRSSGIDEGIFVWRDKGYPVRGGANP
jgi:cytochrome c oxidase cbb3-type subunit 3/ubiquinol-cytochrome c reductase cytochrome c subunit